MNIQNLIVSIELDKTKVGKRFSCIQELACENDFELMELDTALKIDWDFTKPDLKCTFTSLLFLFQNFYDSFVVKSFVFDRCLYDYSCPNFIKVMYTLIKESVLYQLTKLSDVFFELIIDPTDEVSDDFFLSILEIFKHAKDQLEFDWEQNECTRPSSC